MHQPLLIDTCRLKSLHFRTVLNILQYQLSVRTAQAAKQDELAPEDSPKKKFLPDNSSYIDLSKIS